MKTEKKTALETALETENAKLRAKLEAYNARIVDDTCYRIQRLIDGRCLDFETALAEVKSEMRDAQSERERRVRRLIEEGLDFEKAFSEVNRQMRGTASFA
jgi:hypothetical protein